MKLIIKRLYDKLNFALRGYICNEITNKIPSHRVRLFFYSRIFQTKIGNDTSLGMHSTLLEAHNISIGNNCAIGQFCYLDGRGSLSIGNNVNIATRTSIYSGTHDHTSPKWEYIKRSVIIDDNVWIAGNAIILPGVHIGEGAIVGAGSVLISNVPPYQIFGGNPAKKIGERNSKIDYLTKYFPYFQ